MKDLIFIQCVPSDIHYCWETELQITNYIEVGYDPTKYRVLVFIPNDRLEEDIPDYWLKLQKKFKECNFYFYRDNEDILNSIIRKINYIPYLRPYMLEKHFKEHPELFTKAIFYWDSDVLFTKYLDFSKFLEDDICYVSDTSHYLNLNYLDTKVEQAIKDKEYLISSNPIDSILEANGISREIALKCDINGTGGAQYLLKNIDSDFWRDVMMSCRIIRPYFMRINKEFFKSESAGFQSWCADMWAVLWNLWKRGYSTFCPEELNFAWATDHISKLDQVYLYHNAGVSNTVMNLNGKNEFLFNKSLFKNNDRIPYKEKDNLNIVSKDYCTRFYADSLLKLENTIF